MFTRYAATDDAGQAPDPATPDPATPDTEPDHVGYDLDAPDDAEPDFDAAQGSTEDVTS